MTTTPGEGLAPGPAPLLAVYAHPDDETLQAGALLALAAAQGRRVVVVSATRGERGEMIGMPEVEGTGEVAEIRSRELRDALAALGVFEHYFLDELAGSEVRWTDSGMQWLAPEVAGPAADAAPTALTAGALAVQADALAKLIRELRPGLVVCDEPGGGYGHPDHIRTHQITMAALDRAAAEGSPPPEVAWVVQEDGRLVAARGEVARATGQLGAVGPDGAEVMVAAGDRPALARAADEIDVELDATSVLPQVLAAMRCYPSQVASAEIPALGGGGAKVDREQAAVGWFVLSNAVAQPILPVVALQRAHREVLSVDREVLSADREVLRAPTPVPARAPQPQPRGWGSLAFGVVIGILAGTFGTLVHRARLEDVFGAVTVPYGLGLALAIVVSGALLARSVGAGVGLWGMGAGVLAAVLGLTYFGAPGDVLVAQDALSLSWLALSAAGVIVAAFLPAQWVARR